MFGKKLGSEKQIRKFAGHIARKKGAYTADVVLFGNVQNPIVKCGVGFYYTTRNGGYIHHPAAYSRRGWSNMIYHPTTPTTVILPYSKINWEKI